MKTDQIESADYIGSSGNTIECVKTEMGFTFLCEDGNNPRNVVRVTNIDAAALAKFILEEVSKLW